MMTGAQWEWGKTFPILMPPPRATPYRNSTPEPRRTPESPALPWDMVQPHERQARINHSAGLQTLANRGGLSWSEMLDVLLDRSWQNAVMADAQGRVLVLLQVHLAVSERRGYLLAA